MENNEKKKTDSNEGNKNERTKRKMKTWKKRKKVKYPEKVASKTVNKKPTTCLKCDSSLLWKFELGATGDKTEEETENKRENVEEETPSFWVVLSPSFGLCCLQVWRWLTLFSAAALSSLLLGGAAFLPPPFVEWLNICTEKTRTIKKSNPTRGRRRWTTTVLCLRKIVL